MNSNFAQLIDPVFLTVFSTLRRIRRTSYDEVRRSMEHAIANVPATERPAKYALTTWIDEMLILAHHWPGQEAWSDSPLERQVFQSAKAFDQFYSNAEEAAKNNAGNVIETYWVCFLLGFHGKLQEEDARSRWAQHYGEIVRRIRDRRPDSLSATAPSRSIATATPYWTWPYVICPWLLTAAVVASWAVWYLLQRL